MNASALTHLHPLLAYGWGGGWWWWWIIALFFIWILLLPPFAYGPRWYGRYRGGVAGVPAGYPASWESIESRFVESPAAGIAEADRVVGDLVAQRGGASSEAAQYRELHAAALKAQQAGATTDDLRALMLRYRTLFDRLAASA